MVPSAAILNGGRARRFDGVDKSGLVVEGRRILDRQIDMLQGVPRLRSILLVGGATIHPFARPIADRVAGCGPLGGIHAALAAVAEQNGDTVFVMACDMPYVTAGLVDYLLDLSSTDDAVVPMTERGYHPLCAVYTRACLEPVARRLRAGCLKVTDVLDEVKTRVVREDELERFGQGHRLLSNVNTPGDYAALDCFQSHQL